MGAVWPDREPKRASSRLEWNNWQLGGLTHLTLSHTPNDISSILGDSLLRTSFLVRNAPMKLMKFPIK